MASPGNTSNSSSDTFLSIKSKRAGGLKGESRSPGHEDQVCIDTWSFGVAASSALGSTQATGKRVTITQPSGHANRQLHAVGATYGVIKKVHDDPSHWSIDGK